MPQAVMTDADLWLYSLEKFGLSSWQASINSLGVWKVSSRSRYLPWGSRERRFNPVYPTQASERHRDEPRTGLDSSVETKPTCNEIVSTSVRRGSPPSGAMANMLATIDRFQPASHRAVSSKSLEYQGFLRVRPKGFEPLTF